MTGSVYVQQAWQHSTNNVYIKSSQTRATLSTLPRLGIPTEVTHIPDTLLRVLAAVKYPGMPRSLPLPVKPAYGKDTRFYSFWFISLERSQTLHYVYDCLHQEPYMITINGSTAVLTLSAEFTFRK